MQALTQNVTKLKSELQFYRNRNKELEGVVARTEKKFKEDLQGLEKDAKANKEVIAVLDKKARDQSLARQEIQRKAKQDVERLSEQLKGLKEKYEGQKIQ